MGQGELASTQPRLASGGQRLLIWRLVAVLAAFALACVFYEQAHRHPVCCDALGYWRVMAMYDAEGLYATHRHADLRTYLYPVLLWLVSRTATALAVETAPLLLVLQFTWHVASCWWLSSALFPVRPRVATVLFAVLVCNPFVLPYLGVSLTDAVALGTFNGWLAAIVIHARRRGEGGSTGWLAVAATAAGVACALRPAYVWLPVLTVLFALSGAAKDGRRGVLGLALSLLLPLIALGPQIAINEHLFQRMTPLPVRDLAGDQVRWGIENFKYATAPVPEPDGNARMFYPNPIAGQTLRDGEGLSWYLHHPLRGVASVAVKLVTAFDFDFLSPYIWERHPPVQWIFRGVSLLILLLGVQGMWHYIRRPGMQGLLMGPPLLPPLVMFAWGTITLAAVVELRFTLPMLSLLAPLCLVAMLQIAGLPPKRQRRQFALLVMALLALIVVARFAAAQNAILHP